MVASEDRLGDRKARIVRLAEKRAFERFLRCGRVPEAWVKLARAPLDEKAFRELTRSDAALKALGSSRPTTHYTWRTARDERVRSAHAANEGRVFAWDAPPPTGHPGHQHNCRCWPEPYYGDPMVSDAALPLKLERRTDTTGKPIWASIDRLTRPDGTLAASKIAMRDGTRIDSTFAGSRVTNKVELPNGRKVRREKHGAFQALFVGGEEEELYGPSLRPAPGREFEEIPVVDPFRVGGPSGDPGVASAVLLGLLALYTVLNAEPDSLGAGNGDVPALLVRTWNNRDRTSPNLEVLTAEQVAQYCKRMPDVQLWANQAATAFAALRGEMSPQNYGIQVHKWIEYKIKALKEQFPVAYQDIAAELSIDRSSPKEDARRGQPGTSRMDVFEQVNKDLVCVYDVKTGGAKLTAKQLREIAAAVVGRYGLVSFLIVEVRPRDAH